MQKKKKNTVKFQDSLILKLLKNTDFVWKCKAKNEESIHGIGPVIKTLLLKHLPDLPTTFNKNLMNFHFAMNASQHITVSIAMTQIRSEGKFLQGPEQSCEDCIPAYTHTAG